MIKKHYLYIGLIFIIAFVAVFISIQKVSSDNTAWSYDVPRLTSPVSNGYFAETGWREILPWEIEQCTRGLSSEITSKMDDQSGFTPENFVYDTGFTLQAMKETFYANDTYYEIAGYIEPAEKIPLSIIVYNEDDRSIKKEVIGPLDVSAHGGEGYYKAWEDTKNYTMVIVTLGTESLTFPIEEKPQQ